VSPFDTQRKVYAMGARVSEIPLDRPAAGAIEAGLASVALPLRRNPRSRNFRKLRDGAVPGYSPLSLDRNDPETVDCAFRQRLLRDLPPPREGRLRSFALFVKRFLGEHVPVVRPMEFEEWLGSTSYNEERKKQLREAWQSLRGGRPTRHQSSHIDTFVKSEFYVTWKHARMINSRADVFKAWSGPRFKSIEDAVYSLPEFIKHTPVPERPSKIALLKRAGRRYFQTDFTAFESHFTPAFLDVCECELYRHCLANDNDANFLCSVLTGSNRMRTRTGVRATVRGRRMSGDMCTSLGNGFTNLMLAKFLVYEKGGSLEGFVEGDDGLFSTDVELTKDDYAGLGFSIKIVEVADPCEASFCGLVFSPSGEIIRDPRRFMMGFGWTQSFVSAGGQIMDELLRAKALSCVYETPQCPIVGAFARRALSRTRGVVPRFVNDGYHVPHDESPMPDFCPSSDTRLLFEREYGVSVLTQLQVEDAVAKGDFLAVSLLLVPMVEQFSYTSMYVEIT